jgi:hypothetical protein
MSQTTDPRQFGDATVLRARNRSLTYQDTITIHQARNGNVRINLDTRGSATRAAIGVDDLPELIHTLIARSGRTDLALVVTEPQPDEEQQTEASEDQDAPACGYCGHVTCQCPTAAPA